MKNLLLMATNIIAKTHTTLFFVLSLFLLTVTANVSHLNAQEGDNLGNHIATKNLQMGLKNINNVRFIDIKSGTGNGLRFWGGSNAYSISMGNTAPYKYGTVTSFSIKTI